MATTRSKKYKTVNKKIKKEELAVEKAIEEIKKASYSKFAGSVELKVNLAIDPKDSEQNVRFVTEIPYPSTKKRNVLVFNEKEVKGDFKTLNIINATDKSIEDILANKLTPKKDFDLIVTDPKSMPKLAKAARVLGPKGAMPSPKTGTVGNVEEILQNLDKGQVEVRSQHNNRVVHLVIGNTERDTKEIVENFNAIIDALVKHKPAKIKKTFIESAYVSATMSPSIKVALEL